MRAEFRQPNVTIVDECDRFYSGEPDSLNDIRHSQIPKGQVQIPLRNLAEIGADAVEPQEIK